MDVAHDEGDALMAPRDYARLHFDWFKDDTLRAIGEVEPAVMAIWPVLLGMAKYESHATKNPNGVVQTTYGVLAHNAMVTAQVMRKVLKLLKDGGFIRLESSGSGVLAQPVITLTQFSKWQVPRSGAAERKQAERDAISREKAPERHADVAPNVTPSWSPVTETETRDREEGQENTSAQAPTTDIVKSKPTKAKPEDDPQVIACFAWYCELWGKVGAFELKLTPERARAIQKALKDRGPQVVAAAIRGHYSNEWRHGQLNRNDITKLLRPQNIDEGVELAAVAAGVRPATSAPVGDDMESVY